ncbi:fluoride efflux transporter CrcB [Pseudoblastomonas halimionae]|uniref:Fluoride-specific ion channel FluC n=1 Tax=Alteriqipengyuania halimionae TaxID=1926630 RepID=A0A6I4U5R1_9SPHN|nr:fluoride efflux transporter CrcB [Alteriqipengyuania halimionae]MXP10213.1 fluoride efflux transporter CrcB [Alteriqipengyuania halimionae]
MAMPTPFTATALVALGGGTGAAARYWLGRAIGAGPALPWGTFAANIIGSMAIGILAGWLARHGTTEGFGSEHWRLLLGVGLLGGFTTFSAFSLESVLLIERGQAGLAALYIGGSVLAGMAALFIGLKAGA